MSDSRKQIWKFQEGAVVLALRECCGESKVHWDHTPKGMSIDPDVVVGDSPENPEVVVFVTHATAEMSGHKKFWRTVAEVVEAKRLDSVPRVISVLFASNVKSNLLDAYKLLFDSVVHLDDMSWGGGFSNFLIELTESHGSETKEKCVAALAAQIGCKGFLEWQDFASSINDAFMSQRGRYDQRIASSSFNKNTRIPEARKTTLRRSLCKYYTFPSEIREKLKSNARLKAPPEYAIILEWVSRSIGGYRLTDQELNQFLASADQNVLNSIVSHIDVRIPVFQDYVDSLRNTAGRLAAYNWIIENHSLLSRPEGMRTALEDVFNDPIAPFMGSVASELAPTDHWLFGSIMELLRAETGRKDGYGYSELGRETGFEYEISALAGTTIAPFLQRKAKLNSEILQEVAKVFAAHLNRIGESQCRKLMNSAVKTGAVAIFNYKITPYRHFNPLEWLVCDRLEGEGHLFEFPERHPSFLSQTGMGTTTSTGNMISIDGGRCWIKCQSAYAGKIDKRKELCGRIGAMKLCYTPEELDQKKFYLVIDGFFDDHDLALLDQAGWDGIFYYDEMDDLMALIA